MNGGTFSIVIPTIGRSSLGTLLQALETSVGPLPDVVAIVDDRRGTPEPLELPELPRLADRIRVVRSGGRGPAAARNRGWRAVASPWIAFLDDDVVVETDWLAALARDLAAASDGGATQGRVTVPLPIDRKPTDWERNVAGLATARWITADCAYRRNVLERLGGFNERFPRAYREDADLALRTVGCGFSIARGTRRVLHPVRPSDPWVSVRLQAGNADDALMASLHGRAWHARAGASRGAFSEHVRTVTAALLAIGFALLWAWRTAAFAWRRIEPGPRTRREVATMAFTSAAIPFAAVVHRLRGELALRGRSRTALALFDRDGTLIEDVRDLRDPADVRPMVGARTALDRLRAAGVRVGVVTNQAAVGEGRVTPSELAAVHARLAKALGPFDVWAVCAHAADAGCACRKPLPELVLRAARETGVEPSACVVVGDIGSDVDAARTAGAEAILVPTPVTLDDEIARAPRVAQDLHGAVDMILAGHAS